MDFSYYFPSVSLAAVCGGGCELLVEFVGYCVVSCVRSVVEADRLVWGLVCAFARQGSDEFPEVAEA